MRMVKYVKQHKLAYCVVHKVDRLARNRLEDVDIHRHLINAGVHLVSATENIDETPAGMLFHGIMSSIAGFYSRNLAAEATARRVTTLPIPKRPSGPVGRSTFFKLLRNP